MNILLLGAGASKSYTESKTQVKMPIAKDFFKTFNKLKISTNRWVLVGSILNYLNTFHSIPYLEFLFYDKDIEILHSEIEERLSIILEQSENLLKTPEGLLVYKAYNELIFIFASVINEIQNGPISQSHINLAKNLNKEDIILTFNWDTLMDRALYETTSWKTDNGYLVKPTKIFRNAWIERNLDDFINSPMLLKLHGSTNWLTSHFIPGVHSLKLMQETPVDDFYIYESTNKPYATYKGRYMQGYSNFSYGYYPPNLPLKGGKIPNGHVLTRITFTAPGMPPPTSSSEGLVSMPLIIPPVKNKNYSQFGSIFSQLWEKAEDSITRASRIIIIGYSFPVTDTQTDIMFKKGLNKRIDFPEIIIVDPQPEHILDRLVFDYGIDKSKIKIYKAFFSKDFETNLLFK
jgi:hypothetical protein